VSLTVATFATIFLVTIDVALTRLARRESAGVR
jgi:hypothetical protein